MSDLIGELFSEVFEAFFQLMKFPHFGRSRKKKPRVSTKVSPTLDGRPPHVEVGAK